MFWLEQHYLCPSSASPWHYSGCEPYSDSFPAGYDMLQPHHMGFQLSDPQSDSTSGCIPITQYIAICLLVQRLAVYAQSQVVATGGRIRKPMSCSSSVVRQRITLYTQVLACCKVLMTSVSVGEGAIIVLLPIN